MRRMTKLRIGEGERVYDDGMAFQETVLLNQRQRETFFQFEFSRDGDGEHFKSSEYHFRSSDYYFTSSEYYFTNSEYYFTNSEYYFTGPECHFASSELKFGTAGTWL